MGRIISKTVSQARRYRRETRRRWIDHQRGCWGCHDAYTSGTYIHACDEGWELAKADQAARVDAENAVAAATGGDGTNQLGLF